MRGFGFWVATWVAAMLLGTAGHAQPAGPGRNAIAASLIPESTVAVPGETVTLALMMRPSQGWHGYWKNPGDSGMETQIAWDLPAGLTAGPIQYPMPERLIVSGLMNYVYAGDYAQLIDVKVPAGLATGTRLPIRARVDYLACTDEICVPETANVAVDLEAGSTPGAQTNRVMFDSFRQKLPKPLGSEARLAAFQREGRPVFVYFTADWCVTCKVNEKGALERQPVADAFAAKDVAVLVGDWTRGDAAIGRFLEKHGRSGVPLYLYYAPDKPVEILPQVLTPSRLVSMVN